MEINCINGPYQGQQRNEDDGDHCTHIPSDNQFASAALSMILIDG
jgi:hypothetical protein